MHIIHTIHSLVVLPAVCILEVLLRARIMLCILWILRAHTRLLVICILARTMNIITSIIMLLLYELVVVVCILRLVLVIASRVPGMTQSMATFELSAPNLRTFELRVLINNRPHNQKL